MTCYHACKLDGEHRSNDSKITPGVEWVESHIPKYSYPKNSRNLFISSKQLYVDIDKCSKLTKRKYFLA